MIGPRMLSLRAPAKLNLTLEALSRREDGYHELDTLMLTVGLYDTVTLTPGRDVRVQFEGLPFSAPSGESTVSRAIRAYQSLSGDPGLGAVVAVRKSIPAEAGLGGGSADAAATLVGMQQLYHKLDEAALLEAALFVGADVPFCMKGGVCRARGVGERLTPLHKPRRRLWFLIVKPDAGISTKNLFANLTSYTDGSAARAAIDALATGDLEGLGLSLYNGLTETANRICPEANLYELKYRLLQSGALGADMTGSGAAVFGLFADEKAARRAYERFPDLPFRAVAGSV